MSSEEDSLFDIFSEGYSRQFLYCLQPLDLDIYQPLLSLESIKNPLQLSNNPVNFQKNISYLFQQTKTPDYSNEIFNSLTGEEVTSKCEFVRPPRRRNQIEISETTAKQRQFIMRGTRFETHNLGRHFFQQTLNYLKLLQNLKQIGLSEIELIEKFMKSKGSLKSYNSLFKNEVIRQRCLLYYSSSHAIESILGSISISITMKKTMIKFVGKLRKLLYQPSKGWK